MANLHHNAQGDTIPGHLWAVASDIRPLLSVPGVLELWRKRVADWLRHQRAGVVEEQSSHLMPLPLEVSRPTGFRAAEYIPLPLDLTLIEKYAVLGAVHDFALGNRAQVERIEPHDSSNDWIPFLVLKATIYNDVEKIPAVDAQRLLAFLEEVKADLKVTQPAPAALDGGAFQPGVDNRDAKAQPVDGLRADSGDGLPGKSTDAPPVAKKPKRSTNRGEGREKLIAALTKHHDYATGSCLNLEPIGNNELADEVKVSGSTASAFFKEQFGGHDKYVVTCRDSGRLADALKALRGEFTPKELRLALDEEANDLRRQLEDE
jgi:hypothetical protein